MSTFSAITPDNLRIANEVLAWAESFLVPETPDMKRPYGKTQAVCPFVKPSIGNNSFYMVFHDDMTGKNESRIRDLILSYAVPFGDMPPYGSGSQLKALLVIFPEIIERDAAVLSRVAANVKPEFIKKGLMLAPFYKNCQDKSVHNNQFYTSQSPHPLIAIRHMAPHDILFVGERVEWFDAYNRHFGERFRDPKNIDEHDRPLEPLYNAIKEKFRVR